jgi:hypothetical protein
VRATVSGNSATLAGSGGGGIYNFGGVLDLQNSTISGNQAPYYAGIMNFDGETFIRRSTISGNHVTDPTGITGGICNFGSVLLTVENSIIAGNTGVRSFARDVYYASAAPITASGANLIGNNSTVTATFPPGPLVGTEVSSLNPRLAPLGDYGGPTQIMPPLPGSPAIEHAVPLPGDPATDQRGAPRPTGPKPDLGAVEAFAFSSLQLVDTDNDGIDDRLEPAYGLVVGVDNRATDTDGDGQSDAVELANMTDPNNAADNFRFLAIAPALDFVAGSNPSFDVALRTFPGLGYALESSATLQSFQVITNSAFNATDHAQTRNVILAPGQNFLRARRN